MIIRDITEELRRSAAEYPIVTILGPRQSGKTTLARMTYPEKPYFSLEDPDIRIAAEADPRAFLGNISNGGILDEIQRLPMLLSYLQGMADNDIRRGRFILTGSHQPKLHEAITQSLAGRTTLLTLWPFSLSELRHYSANYDPYDLIVHGSFPRLHEEKLEPRRFFNGYLQTYVERDVRALIQLQDLSQFQRFLFLLAGRTGQVVNYTALANDIGVTSTTIKKWIGVLQASYIVFELLPFSTNLSKRVIRSPKIFFTDVGLVAFLLGIHNKEQAMRDPLRGQLYENLIISSIMKEALNRGIRPEAYFYRDTRGNEVDLLIREAGTLTPIEIKSSTTFTPDFLKGIERFKALGIGNTKPGAVLYDGDRQFNIHGTRVYNPLRIEDIWGTLVVA
jgi:uncharacterized protein